MSEIMTDATRIAIALIGVAIIALLVKNASGTTGLINSLSSGFGNSLLAAENGGQVAPNFGH